MFNILQCTSSNFNKKILWKGTYPYFAKCKRYSIYVNQAQFQKSTCHVGNSLANLRAKVPEILVIMQLINFYRNLTNSCQISYQVVGHQSRCQMKNLSFCSSLLGNKFRWTNEIIYSRCKVQSTHPSSSCYLECHAEKQLLAGQEMTCPL